MSDPIRTETSSHITATFQPGHGIVVEIMGLGHVSRITLNPQAARDLAEQLDFAALAAPGAHPCGANCQLGDHQ